MNPATETVRTTPAGRGDMVWVVDDDRSIRWVLEKALAREGIPHQTFSSAFEVRQALALAEPQVLVSDIRMPGESGLLRWPSSRSGIRTCRSSS